jgi:hypothetical protein
MMNPWAKEMTSRVLSALTKRLVNLSSVMSTSASVKMIEASVTKTDSSYWSFGGNGTAVRKWILRAPPVGPI